MGTTYIEINYDSQWVSNSIANIQGWSWIFEWGMYLFLLLTAAIAFWIFFDSINKKKDQKALLPRILSLVGIFLTIPAYIFRFVGTADGVTTMVKLGAEPGAPYYNGPINWNVNWLVNGYGNLIAILCLVGVLVGIVALVIYASSVQRAKIPTEFANQVNGLGRQVGNLESKVEDVRRQSAAAPAAAAGAAFQQQGMRAQTGTLIDQPQGQPRAATIIDVPKTGDAIMVQTSDGRGQTYNLSASNVTIGRDPKCHIVVNDGKVSGEHCMLIYSPNGWSIVDNGSTNGTYYNGQRLMQQQPLAAGDRIKIGDTILIFGKAM